MNTLGKSCVDALRLNLRNAAPGLSAHKELLATPIICSRAGLVEREGEWEADLEQGGVFRGKVYLDEVNGIGQTKVAT